MKIKLQSYTDRNGKPRFRGVARNGEIVFASEAYTSVAMRAKTMRRLSAAVLTLDD